MKRRRREGGAVCALSSVTKQLQILGGVLLLIMLVIAAVVFYDNRESTYGSVYIATAGDMHALAASGESHQPRAAGNPLAFRQLRDSHREFVGNLERLKNGGDLAGTVVPPSPLVVGSPQPRKASQAIWTITDEDAVQLLDNMESNLVALRKDVSVITDSNSHLLELAEQVATLKLQTGAGVREIAAANQLVMLTQRIAKNASSLLAADETQLEVAFCWARTTTPSASC